jgi:PKD repeat protein
MENISAITIANTIIMINTSSATNVTIAKYASSPDYLPNNLSTIGRFIDIEIEDESVVDWPINISIYYTSQDLVEAEVSEACLDGIYYFDRSLNNWMRYDQTGVNTTNTGVYEGYCWAEVCRGQLSPKTIGNRNNPPSQPSNPSPNATSGVSINPSLSLTVYDVDGNNMTVSFFDNQTDTEIDVDDNVSNGSVASITWSNRAYSTNYEWYVIVNDSKTEITSSVYEFSTRSRPSSPSSSPGFAPPPGPTNPLPVADADGPYHGYVNRSILFDGSGSSDDGSLVNFSWDFDDGSVGFGMSPMHMYDSVGNYSVVLTVMDDNDSTGMNTTMVRVDAVAPVPPIADADGPYITVIDQPIVLDGSGSGDSDGSIVNYTWMGGYNKTWYGENPKVSYPISGTFSIRLTVTDDGGLTDNDTTTATIYVGESVGIPDGYVVDTDGDGTVDSYLNESSGIVTTMQETDDGDYLIDDNNDGTYDQKYDPANGGVTSYSPPATTEEDDNGNIWVYVAIIIIAIIAIIIFILFKMGILVIE